MNVDLLPWLLPLPIIGFVAFWCLISVVISWMGWARLASCYAVEAVPVSSGESVFLSYLRVGRADYKNVVRARFLPQGLVLSTVFLFRLGHRPLLIPWSAIGPVSERKFLWSRTYHTTVQCGDNTVNLQFRSSRLLQALEPHVSIQA